jgi:hypothetical protein
VNVFNIGSLGCGSIKFPLLFPDCFLLSNSFLGFIKRQFRIELVISRRSCVSDTDEESVTDHLVTSVTVVAVISKFVQLHAVYRLQLSRRLADFVE